MHPHTLMNARSGRLRTSSSNGIVNSNYNSNRVKGGLRNALPLTSRPKTPASLRIRPHSSSPGNIRAID
jgi:hypothetical protein